MDRRLDMVFGGTTIHRRITEIITEMIGTERRLRPRIECHIRHTIDGNS